MSAPARPSSPVQSSSASLTTTVTASTSPPTTRSSIPPAGGPPSSNAPPSASSLSSPLLGAPPPRTAAARVLPTLPLPTLHPTPTQTAQARDALVASLGNALDTELQSRAALLHGNARALAAQERDVSRALEDLRREDDKLLKVLSEGSRKVKELGDVQNWAERLERDFLVVEETMRLVRSTSRDSGSDRTWSGSESSRSWSGSESGSEERSEDFGDEEGDVRMREDEPEEAVRRLGFSETMLDKGKGKQVPLASSDAMDVESVPHSPHQNDTTEGSGSSSIVTAIKALEQDNSAAASPLSSPGASSWFMRFIWRS